MRQHAKPPLASVKPQKGENNPPPLVVITLEYNTRLRLISVIRDLICWITAKSSSPVSRSKNNCGFRNKSTAGMQFHNPPPHLPPHPPKKKKHRLYIRQLCRRRRKRGARSGCFLGNASNYEDTFYTSSHFVIYLEVFCGSWMYFLTISVSYCFVLEEMMLYLLI